MTYKPMVPTDEDAVAQPNTPGPWYGTLGSDARERLFAAMRKLDADSQASWGEVRRLTAPAGTLAVGAGAFGPLARAVRIDAFLSALRRGADPCGAAEHSRAMLREAVVKHNANRPNDTNWQRHINHGEDGVPHLVWVIEQALSQPEIAHSPDRGEE